MSKLNPEHMTNIIVGQNISGSLTSDNPKIVDATSPFNGQFYDDFDLGSVNVIDPNNFSFLLAANQELGNIGSVKIGETRSTNIFIQPPAGSVPGASTVIQLINTATNSVDAQAISSSSEALKFVKNAEILGSNYKIRVINATPGSYEISLAGAIQAVQVVGTNLGSQSMPTSTPLVDVAAPVAPEVTKPETPVLAAVVDPIVSSQPVPTFLGGQNGLGPAKRPPMAPESPNVGASPGGVNPNLAPTEVSFANIDPTVVADLIVSSEPIPTRGENPLPNEREGVQTVTDSGSTVVDVTTEQIPLVLADSTTAEIPLVPVDSTIEEIPLVPVDSTIEEINPVIFQNAVPTPEVAFNVDIGARPSTDISTSNIGVPAPASTFSNIVLTNNFLTTIAATGFGISAVSQKAGGKVSEIGLFAVDDATGKIGGIAPGAAGYLQAIGNSARSIFSTLGGSFFDSSSKREIALDPNKIYGFFQVQDGSIADLQQQLISGKVPTNILSSLADDKGNVPIKVTNNDITGGYNVSVNNDELVLSVVKLDGATPNVAIGAKSQGLAEGRTIDLTGVTGPLKVDITTKSSAAYNNNVGFYVVEDSIGTIKLANGETRKPGDADYAVEAVKSALANSLQAGKTDSKLGRDITGGLIYAPVVVSQSSLSDFVTANPKNIGGSNNNAYFNYVLGNADKKDHFRLIGDNTFGVEDQLGGGDRDFNDLVVNVKIA
jgi:Domain of unknown function (DUF4114)